MKKLLLTLLCTGILLFSGSKNASASIQWVEYVGNVPLGLAATSPWLTANSNYVWGVHKIISQTPTGLGNPQTHATWQTWYNNKAVAVGSELSMSSKATGNMVWRPTNISNDPSSFPGNVRGNCNGYNTTANWCGISGSRYRIALNNKNFASGYNIRAQVYLVN